MAGLVPAIYVFAFPKTESKTWIRSGDEL